MRNSRRAFLRGSDGPISAQSLGRLCVSRRSGYELLSSLNRSQPLPKIPADEHHKSSELSIATRFFALAGVANPNHSRLGSVMTVMMTTVWQSHIALAQSGKLIPIEAETQYRGTRESTCSDHASMPPARLATRVNPFPTRYSATLSDRTPWWQ